jgi:hypothetical protein
VHTPQETHYVSATEPNRLMLFGEKVAVYCQNHTEHTDTLYGQNVDFIVLSRWYLPWLLSSEETVWLFFNSFC